MAFIAIICNQKVKNMHLQTWCEILKGIKLILVDKQPLKLTTMGIIKITSIFKLFIPT
jgi:hypothetical protein